MMGIKPTVCPLVIIRQLWKMPIFVRWIVYKRANFHNYVKFPEGISHLVVNGVWKGVQTRCYGHIYIFEQYQHICFKSELDGSSISHKMKYSGILEGSNRWWSLVIVYNTEYGSYNHHLCNLSRATKLRWYNKSERVYIHIHIYIYTYIYYVYIYMVYWKQLRKCSLQNTTWQ
jgi:hypothetical protein